MDVPSVIGAMGILLMALATVVFALDPGNALNVTAFATLLPIGSLGLTFKLKKMGDEDPAHYSEQ